jgi:hypothetical protein
MKFKLIALSVILAAATGAVIFGVSKANQKPDQQQIEELEARGKKYGLTLGERVKLAKLRNERKITIQKSYSTSMYGGFGDMETAAALCTIVVARPVAAVSRLDERGQIETSYKFETVETLSEPGASRWPFTFSGELPSELGSFRKGGFLVTTLGGTKEIDGVEVTSKYDDFELFSIGKEYLLFLEFDTKRTVGGLKMGPLGAMEIGGDGTLSTLDRRGSHDFKQMIDARFGNSVGALKTFLKSLPKRQGYGSAKTGWDETTGIR